VELPVADHLDALRGNPFVVVGEGSEARAVLRARVGDHVDNGRGVPQVVQLIERQKTCACEVGFLAKDAIEFDGMADGFVNLQTKLAATEDQCPGFLRALSCRMQPDGFLSDSRRVSQQLHRFNEFIAAENVLPAETVRIRTLLNAVFPERGGHDAAPGNDPALVDLRAGA